MEEPRDPVQGADDGSQDLYGIARWEPRTRLDGISASVYRGALVVGRAVVVLLALVILGVQVLFLVQGSAISPLVVASVLLSVIPALALAGYVWRSDVTTAEPLTLLVGTFLLGLLFAGFAAVVNSVLQGLFAFVPVVGLLLFFYLVVAPVEETVKLLAVRLYPYRRTEFDAVVDGAVYGAMAGLGFATIENGIYITRGYLNAVGSDALLAAFQTASVRTLAGPGHVIYSGFAGYYLGLAKFNPENRGPIVVKGLLVAAFIHGTYNTLATLLPAVAEAVPALAALPPALLFVGFVLVYDGFFGYLLYRKLARYRSAYHELEAHRRAAAVGADARGGASARNPAVGDDEERSPSRRAEDR